MIISVFGAAGTGKTTIATKLAVAYAKRKQNVILLSCDSIVSGISQLGLEQNEKNENKVSKSIGKLLSNITIGSNVILKECVTTKWDYLGVLGYNYGETSASYPQYFQNTAAEVITNVSIMTEVLIIDCTSDIISDLLSTVALQMSDKIIRVCTAEPKSMIYYDAILPLLSDSKFKIDNHIKILNNIKDFQEIDLTIEKYKGVEVKISYDEEIEKQWIEGGLLEEKGKIKEPIQHLIKIIEGEEDVTTELKGKGLIKQGKIKFKKRSGQDKVEEKKEEVVEHGNE